jgi:hypothetical protein
MRFLPLLPLVLAFALVSIPLLGQLLPANWRNVVLERRTRTYCTAAFQALIGGYFCMTKGWEVLSGREVSLYNLIFIALGGVMIGLGAAQALAATRLSLLLGERWSG